MLIKLDKNTIYFRVFLFEAFPFPTRDSCFPLVGRFRIESET